MRTEGSNNQCSNFELQLFDIPPTQSAIEEGSWDKISPIGFNDTSNIITFDIPPTDFQFVNLPETEIHMTCRLLNDSKAGVPASTNIPTAWSVTNNFLHSMFSQVQIYLNNAPVENTNDTYPYRAYFENLLCYNKESKDILLYGDGFVNRDLEFNNPGLETINYIESNETGANYPANFNRIANVQHNQMNKIDIIDHNTGLKVRQDWFVGGKSRQFCGKLHCDIFNINRYLLNNINIKIVLQRSDRAFHLWQCQSPVHPANTALNGFNIVIDNIFLKIRRHIISPSTRVAIYNTLEKTTAKYPFKRVKVRHATIPFSSDKFTLQNLNAPGVPTRIVFGFVRSDALKGSITKNPFYFENLGIKEMKLTIGSKPLPYSHSLILDYDNNMYFEAYQTLFKNIREASHSISYDHYKYGSTIYAFDLTPDLCSDEHYSNLKTGSLDLEISLKDTSIFRETRFSYNRNLAGDGTSFGHYTPTHVISNVSYSIVYYMEFDNIIEISKNGGIQYDYSV